MTRSEQMAKNNGNTCECGLCKFTRVKGSVLFLWSIQNGPGADMLAEYCPRCGNKLDFLGVAKATVCVTEV